MYQTFGTFLFPALLLLSTSCKKELKNETVVENALITQAANSTASGAAAKKTTEAELLKSVKQATSRFHSTTQAIKAGYEEDNHCVSHPVLGGMGYHWVNPLLVDPIFDPLKPEAVLYAPGPGGNLRLVGLEYIVINVGQTQPMFGNKPFDVGGVPPLGETPHWSLHVWLYEDNPSGMFAPFNPNVSCQ
jgi:hypothetical protein